MAWRDRLDHWRALLLERVHIPVGRPEEEQAESLVPRIPEHVGCPDHVGDDLGPGSHQLLPGGEQIVDRERERRAVGRRRQEALVVPARTVDLDKVAIAGLEREDALPVVQVRRRQPEDIANEPGHGIEVFGPDAHETDPPNVHH